MDDALRQAAIGHRLGPGDALHVPFKAPHWVDVEGTEASVSLSVTWTTAAAQAQNDAWCWNAWARKRGLSPRAVPPLPARPWLRAGAMRLLRRCGQS